jgi:UDPglucose 6-dehydrogenase/GDP-mannose 6-dehydrogenase
MYPDRIILGGMDDETLRSLESLYKPFTGVDIIKTSNRTAEMIKYTSNALLATLISFSNEIANLCSTVGEIDAKDVMQAVHLDRRISPILPTGERIVPGATTYLEPGCGFGGSCFPKDVNAFISYGRQHDYPLRLLQAVMDINTEQPRHVLRRLKLHFPSLQDVTIAVLGLAFKPGTDDMRESPAVPIIRALLEQGARVTGYDPAARFNAKQYLLADKIICCDTLTQAIEEADAILVLTRWNEFKDLPILLRSSDRQPLVIDARRMFDPCSIKWYDGIGR